MTDMEILQRQTSIYADFLQEPVVEKNVFFLASKEGILKGLFDAMEKDLSRQGYSIYWTVSKRDKETKEWCRQRGITLVVWKEEEYLRLLATSAYLLSDIVMPIYFSRRQGQSYWNLAVIQDPASIGKKYSPEYERKAGLWRLSQNFLQSSYILAGSERDIQLLREDYRLEDVYDGRVCKIEGIHQQDAQIETLRNLILQKDPHPGQAENVRLPVKKHKVLIQLDWNQKDYLREWMPLWLEYVDYDKYDVTLVTRKPKDAVDMYKLAGLPQQVRVMIQRGYTLIGNRQKREVDGYVDGFWLMPEDERKNGHLDMQEIYGREWDKIFGCACFDTVVFTSTHPLWYLGAIKNCANKVFICTRVFENQAEDSQEDRWKWENIWEAMREMKALFWFGTERLPFGQELDGLQKLPTPVPLKWLEDNTGRLTIIQYQGKEYALLLQGRDWGELHGQVEFIPIPPAGQRAYVASGMPCGEILTGFMRLREEDPGSLLYVFTGDQTGPAEVLDEEAKGSVVLIGGTVCGDIPGAFEYFQRFRGCLVHGGDDSGPLPSLMGLLGRPVYQVDGGHTEEISIQVDKDGLYTQGKDAVAHIWGD